MTPLSVLTDMSGSGPGQRASGLSGSDPASSGGSDRISQSGLALQPRGCPLAGRQTGHGGTAGWDWTQGCSSTGVPVRQVAANSRRKHRAAEWKV